MFTLTDARRRARAFAGAAILTAAVGASTAPVDAGAAAPAAGVVDTPAKVAALLSAQKSASQLEATLDRLSPAEREYVIKEGLTPARVEVSHASSSASVQVPGFSVRAAAAGAPACSGFSAAHDATAKGYSWAGLWLFTYHSDWQWGGCRGRVVTWASHHERGDTQVGWTYDGSSLGRAYGCKPCWMVGRETYGHFSFFKYAVHDTADLQVQVNAGPGWWAWANITGP